MTPPEQERSPSALLARLFSTDWRERQEALDEVQERNPPGLARALLEMLPQNEGNLHAFISALQVLERIGHPLIEDLIGLLESPDLDLRVAVPLVLGSLNGERSVHALVKAAADPNQPENVRFNAIEALGRMRVPAALEPLARLLDDASPFLRYAAALALGQIGRQEAEPHLLPLLDDDYLAEPAVSALAEIGSARSVAGITRWMLAHPDQQTLAVVALAAIEARSEDPKAVRQGFLDAAGLEGQQRVLDLSLPGAVDVLPSSPAWTAIATVIAWTAELGQTGQGGRSALARLLANPGARAAAEAALLRIPGPAPLELVEALNSEDEAHVLSAARVLAASGDPQALPALTALLRREDETLAALGAEGLGRIGGQRALAALTDALAYPKPYVRRVAVNVLVGANVPGLSAQAAALLEHADPGVRESALRLLAQVDPPAASRAALAATRDAAPEVRRAGIEIAARGGDAQALEMLAAAIADKNAGARRAAVQAAAGLPEQLALPLLSQALSHSDGWVRVHAARGLGQIASEPALAALAACFRDPFPPVRSAAVQALARHGGRELPDDLRASLRDLLESAQADESPEVRQAAADALAAGGWAGPG